MSGLDLLKQKLNAYTKAYYKQRALKGLVLWLGVLVSAFIVLSLAEYFFRFESGTRSMLFWTYLGLFSLWFIAQVLVPLMRMKSLIKGISLEDAAKQIGERAEGIDDKILNALGLSKLIEGDQSLVLAAINQKAESLRNLDFKSFVDFKAVRKVLPYALAPLILVLAFSLSEKGREVLKSSQRVVLYNEDFRPPAPFRFLLEEEVYKVEEGESLSVPVELEGDLIPKRLNAQIGGLSFPAIKLGEGKWRIDLEQVQVDQSLRFEALGYESKAIRIEVIESPKLSALQVHVQPPRYTGLKPYEAALSPETRVAEGSQVELKAIGLKATKSFELVKDDGSLSFKDAVLSFKASESFKYDLKAVGNEIEKTVLKGASLILIKDQKPEINASYLKDSLKENHFWVDLEYSDDYGVSKLERVIEFDQKRIVKGIKVGQRVDRLLLDTIKPTEGFLRVFYRVWDNDAVNGAKYRESESVRVNFLSEEERAQEIKKGLSGFGEQMLEQKKNRKDFQESLEEVNRAFNEKKSLAWQDREEIKNLLDKMKQNEKVLQEKKEKLEKSLEKIDELPEEKESLKERLNEMTEAEKELEKLREEIEKLMDELKLDEMQQKLKELQQENQEQNRREQRMDDLLKDLMFQRDLLKEAQKLKDLSEQLKELSERKDESSAEQQDLKDELSESLSKLNEMAQENKQLEDKISSEDFQKAATEAEQNMQEAQENQESGDSDAANENQEDASESAQEMSESLQSLMASMQKQALELNMESLRRILENLKQYSKDIEASGLAIQSLGDQDPRFRDLLKEQSRLRAGSEVIKDSLIVLTEKAPQVKDDVFKELRDMQNALVKAQAELQEQGIAKASTEHQYSMMAANNLALMLDESLQNMMSMMAQKQKGNQNCEKPGNGKPKPGQMSEKMSQMGQKVDKLQKGSKDGKGKEGSQGKQIAEILAEQEALRQMLQGMEEGESGNKGLKPKLLEDLDKMEDALLNENVAEVKERFKRIETRLLESEKAMEERKQKEERQAEEGKGQIMKDGNPIPGERRDKKNQPDPYWRKKLKLNNFYYELQRKD